MRRRFADEEGCSLTNARPYALAAAFCCLWIIAANCMAASEVYRLSGTTMGTVEWQVQVVCDEDSSFVESELSPAVSGVLRDVDARMSTYRADSEVTRFNNSGSTDWFTVSVDTAEVVRRSLELAEQSGGAFDITVKPLVELWNFGAGRSTDWTVPTDAQISDLLQHVGYQKLAVQIDPPALRKSDAAVQIDLSGIAKGYAVDRVGRVLSDRSYAAWFVEIGGEVLARGRKPDGSAWLVGIEQPNDNGRYVDTRLPIDGWAIATSGDYRNFVQMDGKRYSHTISPPTGRPVTHSLASVSVIAPDCLTADAAATALLAAGPDRLAPIAEAMGINYYALERTASRFRVHQSAGFPLIAQAASENDSAGSWLSMIIGAAIIITLAIAGLAIGSIVRGRALRGTCGGLNDPSACDLCQHKDTPTCQHPAASREVPTHRD